MWMWLNEYGKFDSIYSIHVIRTQLYKKYFFILHFYAVFIYSLFFF